VENIIVLSPLDPWCRKSSGGWCSCYRGLSSRDYGGHNKPRLPII